MDGSFEDEIEFENGDKGIYGYVKREDGVGVVIVNQKNEVLLLKQFRYPTQEYQWNLPGGAIDPGETEEDAVRREVSEETGLLLESLEKIGVYYPLCSCSTEKSTVFLSRVIQQETNIIHQDKSDESIPEKRFIPIAEVLMMIDKNEINDPNTCNSIQVIARKLN